MKKLGFLLCKKFRAHRLSHYLHRDKLLILAYHGITKNHYEITPWIQVPIDAFEQQIKYLRQMYSIITLEMAVEIIQKGHRFPKNPAVITFDDGYKNNYTVALPVLEKYGVPATIFLTAGYIGTNKMLPLDRAYLYMTYLKGREPLTLNEIGLGPLFFKSINDIHNSINETIKCLKKLTAQKQEKVLAIFEDLLPNNSNSTNNELAGDFLLLSWNEIQCLLDTGLISIGAHTVSHEILTNVTPEEAAKQIGDSKTIIQEKTQKKITLFAYPNGADADYNDAHVHYLKENGFIGSVTTIPILNKRHTNPYRLGRICIGPELSTNFDHFSLKISGLIGSVKSNLPNHRSGIN